MKGWREEVAVLRKYGTDNRLAKQTALSEAVPSLWSVAWRTVALVAMLWLTQGGDRWRLVSYISHIRFY